LLFDVDFFSADQASKAHVREDGQATHISGSTTGTEIDIQAAKVAVKMFGLDKETALLHINCEGCEYSFLYVKNSAKQGYFYFVKNIVC